MVARLYLRASVFVGVAVQVGMGSFSLCDPYFHKEDTLYFVVYEPLLLHAAGVRIHLPYETMTVMTVTVTVTASYLLKLDARSSFQKGPSA